MKLHKLYNYLKVEFWFLVERLPSSHLRKNPQKIFDFLKMAAGMLSLGFEAVKEHLLLFTLTLVGKYES
jgi:hypothetical protein